MRLLTVLCVCTALACTVPAGATLAQFTAAPSASMPDSGEAHAAALQFVKTAGYASTTIPLLVAVRDQMVAAFRRTASKPADEVAQIVDEVLLPDMEARVGEFTSLIVEVFKSNYTVDDMRQLTAFYHTPLGQRLVQARPKVDQAFVMAEQVWAKRVMQDAIRDNADELRRRGIKQ